MGKDKEEMKVNNIKRKTVRRQRVGERPQVAPRTLSGGADVVVLLHLCPKRTPRPEVCTHRLGFHNIITVGTNNTQTE